MKKIIFLLFLLPMLAYGGNWMLITESLDGTAFYVDQESLVSTGNEISFWTKVNFAKRSKYGDLSSKEKWTINCRTREANNSYVMLYSDTNNKGKFTDSHKFPIDWKPIAPDTVNDSIMKFVCRK